MEHKFTNKELYDWMIPTGAHLFSELSIGVRSG
ncbi:MAG: hypothetical protein IPG32_07510 [Saprospirales bacterium]|nr:hypothetical protein [Saprospirales bacterium]